MIYDATTVITFNCTLNQSRKGYALHSENWYCSPCNQLCCKENANASDEFTICRW